MKNGWATRRLGDVCEIIMGQSPDGDSYNTTGQGVPLINGPVEFSEDSFGKTIRSKFTTQPTKFCKEGDLILCVRGSTTGRMNIAGFDACVGRGVAAIRARQYQPWINHFINWKRDDIYGKGTGATFPNVSGATLADFELVVPPFPEQQRIVGILDEAFAGIATAKANAEKNLQNARALFASHLQSVFTQRGEEWAVKKFHEVCRKITDGTHHSPQKQFSEPGAGRFPYVTSKNIRNNYMDLSNVAYIERAFHDEVYARCQPSLGDVLLTKDGANTGNVTLNTFDEPFSLLSSVCLIKTNHTILKPAFLCYYLQSSKGLSSIVGQMTGAAIKRIVLKDIKEASIPFPPLKEQESIVSTLGSLLGETQRLESIYQQKLSALEALKKSLLHQAFTGKL